jgi:hypothetical protein
VFRVALRRVATPYTVFSDPADPPPPTPTHTSASHTDEQHESISAEVRSTLSRLAVGQQQQQHGALRSAAHAGAAAASGSFAEVFLPAASPPAPAQPVTQPELLPIAAFVDTRAPSRRQLEMDERLEGLVGQALEEGCTMAVLNDERAGGGGGGGADTLKLKAPYSLGTVKAP